MSTDQPPLDLTEQAKRLADLRIAHEAMMLQDAQELLAQNRSLTAAHNKATVSDMADPEVGNIHIGDIIQQAPAVAPAPVAPAVTPQAAPAQAQAAGETSTLRKTLGTVATVGSALLGVGGIGTVVGAWLNQPDPPAVVQPAPVEVTVPPSTDTDTDTQYELRIVK